MLRYDGGLPVDAGQGSIPPVTVDPADHDTFHVVSRAGARRAAPDRSACPVDDEAAYEDAVDYILDECFFNVGQGVGGRKTVDHDAIAFWRDHFRARFLSAMERFGNTWLRDRERVTAVSRLLGERAVAHAEQRGSIDVDCAIKASADVEKYCVLHAARRHRRTGPGAGDRSDAMYAGYWCAP